MLKRMLDTFRDTFHYSPREAEGTQSPAKLTLEVRHMPGLRLADD